MPTTQRLLCASAILLVGVVLGAFAGFPAEALRWERFSNAYEDIVVVTRAEYDSNDNELRVRADSSSATSVLSVYNRFGGLIGVLTRQDGTRHEGRFDLPNNPQEITVRSSEGGHATVLVIGDNPPTVTPVSAPSPTATSEATEPPPSATPTESPTATTEPPEPPSATPTESPTATTEPSSSDTPSASPTPTATSVPPSATPEVSPTSGTPTPSASPTATTETQSTINLPVLFNRRSSLGRG